MEKAKEKLFEQGIKQYTVFVNWAFRIIRGNAGGIIGGVALQVYQKVLDALDGTNEDLIRALKGAKDWMDFIRNKEKSFKTKEEFREWVIQEQHGLLDYATNHDRAVKLKETLEGPEIELK